MRKFLLFFFFICILGHTNAQEYRFRLIPTIGIGEGFYKYQTNPYHNDKYPFLKIKFNPFAPIDLLFGINAEVEINKKHDFSIGIAMSGASFGYMVYLGENADTIITGPNSFSIESIGYAEGMEKSTRTVKIPITYHYMFSKKEHYRSSMNKQDSIINYIKSKRIKVNLGLQASLSFVKLKPEELYYSPYDSEFAQIIEKDTIRVYTERELLNKWGCTASLGVSVFFSRKGKQFARFNINYEQGFVSLYNEHIMIYRNDKLDYKNKIISKGSMVYFGLAFPIGIYNTNNTNKK